MKLKLIKNICSSPLIFPGVFHFIESILSKNFGGFICCWHDLSAEIFQRHVESLHPIKPIPLEELVARFKMGKSTKGCYALTFDDGVGKTVRNISKICIKKEWPVTFYIPTKYLDGEILPYQKVEFINKYLPKVKYIVPDFDKNFKNKIIDKKEMIKILTNLLYFENLSKVNKTLDYFINFLNEEKKGLLQKEYSKPIQWTEIEELSKSSCISFQSHSVTHSALSSLNENEIEYEMIKSKEIIEEHTNKKVHSFCYPYGAEKSIGKIAPKVASRYFSSAVTLLRGRLKKNNPFYLPRIGLYKEDALSFVRLKTVLN